MLYETPADAMGSDAQLASLKELVGGPEPKIGGKSLLRQLSAIHGLHASANLSARTCESLTLSASCQPHVDDCLGQGIKGTKRTAVRRLFLTYVALETTTNEESILEVACVGCGCGLRRTLTNS